MWARPATCGVSGETCGGAFTKLAETDEASKGGVAEFTQSGRRRPQFWLPQFTPIFFCFLSKSTIS